MAIVATLVQSERFEYSRLKIQSEFLFLLPRALLSLLRNRKVLLLLDRLGSRCVSSGRRIFVARNFLPADRRWAESSDFYAFAAVIDS